MHVIKKQVGARTQSDAHLKEFGEPDLEKSNIPSRQYINEMKSKMGNNKEDAEIRSDLLLELQKWVSFKLSQHSFALFLFRIFFNYFENINCISYQIADQQWIEAEGGTHFKFVHFKGYGAPPSAVWHLFNAVWSIFKRSPHRKMIIAVRWGLHWNQRRSPQGSSHLAKVLGVWDTTRICPIEWQLSCIFMLPLFFSIYVSALFVSSIDFVPFTTRHESVWFQ